MYVLQYCSLGETEDSTAWYNKGVALGSLGRNKEAIVCFDEAIKLDPEDSLAWGNKGVALKKFDRDEEAEQCFAKARELVDS